jgi:hypothetical protein
MTDFNVQWNATVSLWGCTVKNSTSDGVVTSGPLTVAYSYLLSNTGAGVRGRNGGDVSPLIAVIGSVFYNNGTSGLWIDPDLAQGSAHATTVSNSDFVSNTGAGIKLGNAGNSVYGAIATNNIFYGNSTYGIDYTGNAFIAENRLTNNAFGANTTAAIHNFTGDIGTVSLSADPFTAKASNDFSLNSTSGGGTSCKAAGWAGATGLFGTGYIDIGALQSQASAPGGGQTAYPIVQ